ncbi:MAG: hypothetical protein R3C71_14130 [Candidatus Krumholzibacteriia bacterium]|nr:hypothetical protein [bacterium]MCB9513990.1 hypothetical protein [Candidatus Latescibacterota bacterium]MCB9517012.1 hypothetical protein [Candidatus Latescibacterota bacterium]
MHSTSIVVFTFLALTLGLAMVSPPVQDREENQPPTHITMSRLKSLY